MQLDDHARCLVAMKRLVISGAIAAVVALAVLVYLAQRSSARADIANAPGNEPPPAKQVPHPLRHVTRLASAEERREIASAIAAATKARHAPDPAPATDPAAIAGAKPTLPTADAQTIVTPLRDAMREALPLLAECYTKALPTLANSRLSVAAHLRLTGDPDIGTLIDADQLHDDVGDKPLPAELDSCLRDTFQQLELPPLAEGDKIDVTYPLAFSND